MIRHSLRHGTTLVAVLVAGLLAVAGSVAAQDLSAGKLATVSVSSAGVHFRPEVEYGSATLTLSGDGEIFRYEFAAGELPFISVFDAAGDPLADGVYRWELKLLPEPTTRRELMIAVTKDGDEAPSGRAPQSGAFAVVDGFIADPTLKESTAGRPASYPGGLGSTDSEPLVVGALAPADRSQDDSDAVSGMCNAPVTLRSASCEANVTAALASQGDPAADRFAAGLGVASRTGRGDSDSAVAAGGLAAAEFLTAPSVESIGTVPPRRFFDPEGANGRPRSEEEQR